MAKHPPSMPDAPPAPAGVHRTSEPRTSQLRTSELLAERGRVLALASMVSVSIYSLVDLLPGSKAPPLVHPVHAIQLASLAVSWLLLPPGSSRRWSSGVLIFSAVLQMALLAGLGCYVGDPYTTPLLATVLTLLAAALLPWTWMEQALVAAIVTLLSLAGARYTTGSLDLALSYPGMALGVSQVFSVMMTMALERSRRQMEAGRLALEQSEARYRQLVGDVDAAVWEIELPSYRLLFTSRDLGVSLGYPVRNPGDGYETHLARVHPEDRGKLASLAGALDRDSGYDHEYRMVAADGRIVWIHERAHVIRDTAGKPVRLCGLSVDTTVLHRDQDALAQRSLHLESINAAMTAHLENKPWAESVLPLLSGAVRATASEFGFAARVDHEGRISVLAFHGVDPRTEGGRALLKAAMEKVAGGGVLKAEAVAEATIAPEAPVRDAGLALKSTLQAFLAVPVVVAGQAVAVFGLGNRSAAYGEEQEREAAAILRAAAVIHEADARSEREAELEERRAQLVEILDASPYLVSTTDNRGLTRYTNPAGRLLLGLGRDEDVTGMAFDQFLEPADARRLVEDIVPAAVRDGFWSGELDILTRDRRKVPTAFVFLAHRDDSGRIRFFSSTARDLTEERRTAEEIRALNEELGRRVNERTNQLGDAMREMEAFSYSVSHDLRAPLRRIDGFCAMLEEDLGDRIDEQQRTWLKRVRSGAQQMGELIDAQLKLSRVSRAPLRRARVDLSAIVENLLAEARLTDPHRDVTWSVEPGLEAEADRELVTILLDNLLSNAWKYTRRREGARIEFGQAPRLKPDDPPSWFVRDNGAGFDMAYAKKLFGTFQRLHSDAEFEGTGVGLATVERIVRRHGGRVWADASPNRGAVFTFTLEPGPRAADEMPAVQDA